jgi:hypothetical protein
MRSLSHELTKLVQPVSNQCYFPTRSYGQEVTKYTIERIHQLILEFGK